MPITNYSVGADPEVLLVTFTPDSPNSRGFIADRIFSGDKNNHIDIGKGCSIHNDGVAVEYNIPPCRSTKQFIEANAYALDYIIKEINKYNETKVKDGEYSIGISGSSGLLYDLKELSEKKEYSDSGCIEVHNVIKMREQPPVKYDKTNPNRYAGGHIHIGWENPSIDERIVFARVLDMCYADLMFSITDYQNLSWNVGRGATVLGELGNVRFKDYGIEYRTPSNHWIFANSQFNSPRTVFKMVADAVHFYNSFEYDLKKDVSLNQDMVQLLLEIESFRVLPGSHNNQFIQSKLSNTLQNGFVSL